MVDAWTGHETKLLRRALRMTIAEFADHLGVSSRTVDKWEARGAGIEPRPEMQRALDTVRENADLAAKSRLTRFGTPSSRNDRRPAQPSILSPVSRFEPKEYEAPGASVVTTALRDVVDRSRAADQSVGPHGVVDSLTLHVNRGDQLVMDAAAPHRLPLLRVLAEMHQLLAWMRFDLGDAVGAEVAHQDAVNRAIAVSDPALLSFVLGPSRGFSLAYGDQAGEALGLLEASVRWAKVSGNARLVAFSLAVGARAHARLGNGRDSLRMLDEAESALARHDVGGDPAWLEVFDASALVGHRASCLLDLGSPAAAVSLFEIRDEMDIDVSRRNTALWALDQADALQQLGDIERSASLVVRAAAVAGSVSSSRIRKRLSIVAARVSSSGRGDSVSEMQHLLSALALGVGELPRSAGQGVGRPGQLANEAVVVPNDF